MVISVTRILRFTLHYRAQTTAFVRSLNPWSLNYRHPFRTAEVTLDLYLISLLRTAHISPCVRMSLHFEMRDLSSFVSFCHSCPQACHQKQLWHLSKEREGERKRARERTEKEKKKPSFPHFKFSLAEPISHLDTQLAISKALKCSLEPGPWSRPDLYALCADSDKREAEYMYSFKFNFIIICMAG